MSFFNSVFNFITPRTTHQTINVQGSSLVDTSSVNVQGSSLVDTRNVQGSSLVDTSSVTRLGKIIQTTFNHPIITTTNRTLMACRLQNATEIEELPYLLGHLSKEPEESKKSKESKKSNVTFNNQVEKTKKIFEETLQKINNTFNNQVENQVEEIENQVEETNEIFEETSQKINNAPMGQILKSKVECQIDILDKITRFASK